MCNRWLVGGFRRLQDLCFRVLAGRSLLLQGIPWLEASDDGLQRLSGFKGLQRFRERFQGVFIRFREVSGGFVQRPVPKP